MTTHGPFTFDADNDADEAAWTFVSDNGTNGLNPSNTARAWSWDNNDTTSSNVGPTSGQGGSPDGYVHPETSSPSVLGDTYTMTFDTILDASAEQFQFNFYTNQRGDDNDCQCEVQINESGGGWSTVANGTFGGSGDPNKVATSGTQIWASRSVDLSEGGVNVDSSTQVRILLTLPGAGTVWHNDYGIDTIQIVGTIAVTKEQDSFRFEDDDGSESGSTFLDLQNTDITRGKEDPFRVRVGMQADGDPLTEASTLQVKETADAATEWRDV